MRLTASLRQAALLLTLPIALGACSFMKPDPTIARITVAADSRLNLDSRNRATPVVVRVYILKNLAAFGSADFFSLYEKDQQTLADAVVWREEMTIQPGEIRRLDPRDPGEGKFVAVLAAFRNIDKANWRSSVQLLPNKTNNIYILAREDGITAAQGIDPALLKPGELPDASQLKAPEMPQLKAPETPSLPSTPSAPSAPSIPARPSLWPR
ncbi:type VI secretion system lipoprotein TssJ [Uliginosibacterium sp. 31-16]|uniref:type VI secretion system lipoprotein TssJ n=1 Tax=Uliginosibacterium sp. 31-16 TaxID=3068315 RepID=UPI00273FD3DF|nr:type VI secretion system lipoprotein TssJ [Uliginosibacterium sp. 31-16]MDP5240067.1 type VI secretion system lipoprotein TssJ [Uliginosibacterium sp. 31-16]